MPGIVHVAVAVIVNNDDEVCISLRHKDSHQGGLWEFPGGKIEQYESVEQALVREIKEELSLDIINTRPLITVDHDYGDRAVRLYVHKVISYQGEASGLEGQQVRWIPVSQLSADDFPAADLPIINAIKLPDKYLITGKFIDNDDFIQKLNRALNSGIKLVQLRLKESSIEDKSKLQLLLERTAESCRQADVDLMLNLSTACLESVDLSRIEFSGFHADSKTLSTLSQRPEGALFSASCHNVEELMLAVNLGSDFMVLSPVQKTASHPDMAAMGWQQFSDLTEEMTVPVYALGGVSGKDLQTAWRHGAQGIAAISALWEAERP